MLGVVHSLALWLTALSAVPHLEAGVRRHFLDVMLALTLAVMSRLCLWLALRGGLLFSPSLVRCTMAGVALLVDLWGIRLLR